MQFYRNQAVNPPWDVAGGTTWRNIQWRKNIAEPHGEPQWTLEEVSMRCGDEAVLGVPTVSGTFFCFELNSDIFQSKTFDTDKKQSSTKAPSLRSSCLTFDLLFIFSVTTHLLLFLLLVFVVHLSASLFIT